MNWWQRLQQVVTKPKPQPNQTPAPSDGEVRVPSVVSALCATEDTLFRVDISAVGVSSISVESPRPLASGEFVVRIPIGLNFENRETQEYVEFLGVPLWCRKNAAGKYEAALRYTESSNSKRDRWLRLVLQSHGFVISEAGDVEMTLGALPCKVTPADGGDATPGVVCSVNARGMVTRLSGGAWSAGQRVAIELGNAEESPVTLDGHVIETEAGEGGTTVGVQFDSLKPEHFQHIVTCIRAMTPA